VNRLGQLRADKVCPTRRESPKSRDFPRRDGLYAEVASRFTPSNKVVKQLGKPRRNSCVYLPLQKSDERRFLQVGGRISQCLAAEHRESKVVNRLGQLALII
ncbi:hypothetical protein, partial [Enterococcus cecorum]|uniref:hypothetical protein n=1 Tax=Enterococcus cecorum TaxID=44008 RepID=UPI001FAC03FF